MYLPDMFIFVNIIISIVILTRVVYVLKLPAATGRLKAVLVFILALTAMYVGANTVFILYSPAIIALSELRPIYDCITLLVFNLSTIHILERLKCSKTLSLS